MEADPPPYWVMDKKGKKIRNPAHVEYMAQKYSDKPRSLSASSDDGDDDDENKPKKYLKDPTTGAVIRNPEYDRYRGLEGQSSQTSTKLDSVQDGGIVDLSRDFPMQSSHLQNPGSRLIESDFKKLREVRRVTVIDNGVVVADYRHKGVTPQDTYNLFSSTKSVTSMILGVLMNQPGVELSVKDTLGDIFKDNPIAWSRLRDQSPEEYEYKRSIRLEEILTMTSGLESMLGGVKGILHMEELAVADAPGSDLPKSLAAPQWDPSHRGIFKYMPSSNILSYVIKEKSGLSPREFADKHIFCKLGIHHNAMKWDHNADGIETSYSQLKLTTMQMCKIGQLYLQDGYSSPKSFKPLFSEEWLKASWSKHVFGRDGFEHWYGYLWALYDREFHGIQTLGDVWCAPGFNGQMIAVCKETNRVAAISRLPVPPITGEALDRYKNEVLKLLSPTRDYTPNSLDDDPPKFVKNPRSGKMMRNPVYDRFMKMKLAESEDESS